MLVNVSVIVLVVPPTIVSPIILGLSFATQLNVVPLTFTSKFKSWFKATSLHTVSLGAIAL